MITTTRIEKYHEKNRPLRPWMNHFSKKFIIITCIIVFLLLAIFWNDALDYRGKISLFAFVSAMILWVGTKIPAGLIALSLLLFIIILKAASPDLLYSSLSEEVVWLMLGAFIIGEAVKQSGLAERLIFTLVRKSNKKSQLLIGLCSIVFALTFFIPSTSGRAALSMPIIQQLGKTFSHKEKNGLAILTPIIILMSTSATLIGAGSHIIGVSLLESTMGQSISYFEWFIWGVPFAIVITLLSFFIIKGFFWSKEESKPLTLSQLDDEKSLKNSPLSNKEKATLALIFILVGGWVTESIHGYDIAFVTMIGATIVMMPTYGIISWKQGMKSVSWNLIIFVATATALGSVLVDTGVVAWIEKELSQFLHLFKGAPDWLIVLTVLLTTVTSHLYITSHTTRALVFIPSLLIFSETIGINPSTVTFLSLIGMNYCVTFPVSSKALLLFYEEGDLSYDAKQLLKISMILMPVYILTMMIFYFTFWRWTGMQL
ncbi:SLC13 family permease [Mesobacillus maritimus]|uniref:SLC13 family permease n=1 Tax=Mesobacillus maritimus TaxID=1643336 RepID=UPI00204191CD|nr:SLC13 family permease [Mesobacillus maritimus]MCM3669700.1 SLC13 family permease [Mesobacillus maritimus]